MNISKKDLLNNYSIEEIENLYYEQFADLDMFKLWYNYKSGCVGVSSHTVLI